MPAYQYSVRIEGVGDVSASTATNKLTRYCFGRAGFDAPATVDPDSLYTDGLLAWPGELATEIDFLAGRAVTGDQTFDIAETDANRATFYRTRHTELTTLVADMTATQTTIDLAMSGVDGVVYLEREAIDVDGASETNPSAGVYRYNCTRAVLETQARSHASSETDDRAVYSTQHILAGRLVQLVRTPLDASSAYDEAVRWSGFLRNVTRIAHSDGAALRLHVDSLLQRVEQTPILLDLAQGVVELASVDDVSLIARGRFLLNTSAEALAGGRNVTGTRQAIVIIDDQYLARASYVPFQDATVFGANVTALEFVGPGARPRDADAVLDLSGRPVREVFSSASFAPSNEDTPGDNTLPLQADRGELLLQLLTSTRNASTAGSNGSYDTGVDALAGEMPSSLIDLDALAQWATTGQPYDDILIGAEAAPVKLGELVRSLLAPDLSVLTVTREGKLTVKRMADLDQYGSTSNVLDGNNVLSVVVEQDRQLYDAVDRFVLRFDEQPGVGFSTISAQDKIKYKRQPRGEHDTFEATARGVRDRDLALSLATAIIQRYHDAIPVVTVATNPLEDHDVGDVLRVTHPQILDGAGAYGVTSQVMLVISRREVFTDTEHFITYKLADVGLTHPRDGYITPSWKVSAWSSPTLTVEANAFTATYAAAPGDPLGDGSSRQDIDACDAGDKLDLVRDGAILVEALEVASVTRASNAIALTTASVTALSGAGVTPAAGDILRVTKYASAVTSQQDDWIFVADASNALGSDTAKTYRT